MAWHALEKHRTRTSFGDENQGANFDGDSWLFEDKIQLYILRPYFVLPTISGWHFLNR